MKSISPQPSRADLAYQALLDEICDGALLPGVHLVQEELAAQLGVSRQPIQQAMARLKGDGLVEEAPGRGLRVTRLDLGKMRAHYQVRRALDQLAAQLAAERASNSEAAAAEILAAGSAIIEAGRKAASSGSVKDMVHHDVQFHACIYQASGNELIAPTAEYHWRFLRRVMGDVLRHAETPESIWRQHDEILKAIAAGDGSLAESLAGGHIERASDAIADTFNDHR